MNRWRHGGKGNGWVGLSAEKRQAWKSCRGEGEGMRKKEGGRKRRKEGGEKREEGGGRS